LTEEWHPGSFTKNFSWGPEDQGLKELHSIIRKGFGEELTDVPRSLFRERVRELERPDYIPLNFFLYNQVRHGTDFVLVDELVFQALNFRHSAHFDRLAVFAFNLSRAGTWKQAKPYQSRPALWAYHYVADRVGAEFNWDARKVSANDIEDFVVGDPRYHGATSRKLATNLNYLYRVGKLADYKSPKPERWWLSAMFLALDRTVDASKIGSNASPQWGLARALVRSGFHPISGMRSMAKDIATDYFLTLYGACGGRNRFSDERTRRRQNRLLPQFRPNDPAPPEGVVAVFHPTNPTARGIVPRVCAVLAWFLAGFETIELEGLDDYDVESYVRDRTAEALRSLKELGIKPSMSADDLTQLMRGE
jgi:hypothetical protein